MNNKLNNLIEIINKLQQNNQDTKTSILVDKVLNTAIDTLNSKNSKICIIDNKTHPLSDKELQKDILDLLKATKSFCNYVKAKEFIKTNQLDKFEEICRFEYKELNKWLKDVGYELTPGKACSYWGDGNLFEEYNINSKGQNHGEYKWRLLDGTLIVHRLYNNGKFVKNFLKENE